MSGSPTPPTIGSASVNFLGGSTWEVYLQWGNGSNYDTIRIERAASGSGSWSEIAQLSYPHTAYSDTSVGDGAAYDFRVRGYNEVTAEYSSYSSTVTATTGLNAPSGLDGTAQPTQVDLTWVDNSQNESGFKIYRTAAGGATFYLLATVGQNVNYYSDTGLTAAQNYKYYVEAYNALITSAASAEMNIFTDDPPNAPTAGPTTATGSAIGRVGGGQ